MAVTTRPYFRDDSVKSKKILQIKRHAHARTFIIYLIWSSVYRLLPNHFLSVLDVDAIL